MRSNKRARALRWDSELERGKRSRESTYESQGRLTQLWYMRTEYDGVHHKLHRLSRVDGFLQDKMPPNPG